MLKRWFEWMKEPDPCPPKLPEHLQQNHFVEKTLWQCDIRFSSHRLAGHNQMQEYTCYFTNFPAILNPHPSPPPLPPFSQRKKKKKRNSKLTVDNSLPVFPCAEATLEK